MESSIIENSAEQFQLATNEVQDAPEKERKEILVYQSSWLIVLQADH